MIPTANSLTQTWGISLRATDVESENSEMQVRLLLGGLNVKEKKPRLKELKVK